MKHKHGVYGYAKYSSFYIGGSSTLHISGYSGPFNVGDSVAGGDNGQKFTNKDNDNDVYPQNCAVIHLHFGTWCLQIFISTIEMVAMVVAKKE